MFEILNILTMNLGINSLDTVDPHDKEHTLIPAQWSSLKQGDPTP